MKVNKKLQPAAVNDSFAYIKRVSVKSRVVYLTIVLALIGALALLPFIYVDVSIQTPGIIQSEITRQTITAPFTGKLVYSNLKENRKVAKGDTLIVLDASAQKVTLESYKRRSGTLNREIVDLRTLVTFDSTKIAKPFHLQSETYSSEFAYFLQLMKGLERKCAKQRVEYKRNLQLYNSKVIAKAEFENSEFSYFQQIDEFYSTLKKKVYDWEQNLQNNQKELLQLNSDIARLETEIASSVVTTKINGTIQQCTDDQVGTTLFSNQKLAELTPSTNLKVVCSVNPSDVGHIRVGQPVKMQVDAFSYMEWGMLTGRVEEISNDILSTSDQKIYFRVKCTLDKDYLSLKNGYKSYVKKGMTVNARMQVTRRSLYSLLFDKVDSWFNPYEKKY